MINRLFFMEILGIVFTTSTIHELYPDVRGWKLSIGVMVLYGCIRIMIRDIQNKFK